MRVNGGMSSDIYFMYNYFLKNVSGPKWKKKLYMWKSGVNSNSDFVFIFSFYVFCFLFLFGVVNSGFYFIWAMPERSGGVRVSRGVIIGIYFMYN